LNFKKIWAIAKKEFLEVTRTKILFINILLTPLIMFLTLTYGLPMEIRSVPIALLDMDKTVLSRSFIDKIQNSKVFKIRKITLNQQDLNNQLKQNDLRALVTIPSGFSNALTKGAQTQIQVIIEGSFPSNSLIIKNYFAELISDFNIDNLQNYYQENPAKIPAISQGIDLKISVWFNSTLRGENYIIPGLIAFCLMYIPVILSALSITKEKETGTIINFYTSSITKLEYILGKMLPYFCIAYMHIWLMILYAWLVAQVPMRGSVFQYFLTTILYTAVVITLGLIIGVLFKSQASVILVTMIVTVTFAFCYCGFLLPLSSLDETSQILAKIQPLTYYIDLSRKMMLKGSSLKEVADNIISLCVLGCVYFGAAFLLLKKRIS